MAEWPRIDVRAVFLQPLLMRADTTRTVAVCMELVGPARAIRKAERAMTEAATEDSLRGRIGQRTSQRQRQREHAAARQEAELAQGHANVRYSAYVTVSVPDTGPDARDELEAAVSPRRPAGQGRAAAPGADVGPAGARPHLRAAALPGAEMRSRAQRAADAERRARARGLRRDRSQRPIARLGRCALPGERPGHQATTAHFQAVYPAVAEAGLGCAGRLHRPRHARRQLRL